MSDEAAPGERVPGDAPSPDGASVPLVPQHVQQADRKLLELLVCPLTKDRLDYDADAQELISRRARLAYPIRDGIPIMLPDEARVLR